MGNLILPDGVEPTPEEKPETQEQAPVEPRDVPDEPDPVTITIMGPTKSESVTTPRFLLAFVEEAKGFGDQETIQIRLNLRPEEVNGVLQSLSQRMAVAMTRHRPPQIVPASMGVHPDLLDKLTERGKA